MNIFADNCAYVLPIFGSRLWSMAWQNMYVGAFEGACECECVSVQILRRLHINTVNSMRWCVCVLERVAIVQHIYYLRSENANEREPTVLRACASVRVMPAATQPGCELREEGNAGGGGDETSTSMGDVLRMQIIIALCVFAYVCWQK